MDEPDYEWRMMDARHCKGHPQAAGATGRPSEHESHKRGLNTKRHGAVDAPGLPVRAIVTEGTRAECQEGGGPDRRERSRVSVGG